jgi:hypothetical protein
VARALEHSDLIIELHGTASILSRFAETHDIRLITSRPRRASDYPELGRLGLDQDRHVSEFREARQQWAVLSAKRPAAAKPQSEFITTVMEN